MPILSFPFPTITRYLTVDEGTPVISEKDFGSVLYKSTELFLIVRRALFLQYFATIE